MGSGPRAYREEEETGGTREVLDGGALVDDAANAANAIEGAAFVDDANAERSECSA